jgi:hypothetical protein
VIEAEATAIGETGGNRNCNNSPTARKLRFMLAKKGSDTEFETVNLTKIALFGAWNYYILPHH